MRMYGCSEYGIICGLKYLPSLVLLEMMKKDGGVEAPISLNGLFFNPNDSDNEEDEPTFDNSYENQKLEIGGTTLNILQNSWHQTNANKVWPGTFLLAEFIRDRNDRYNYGNVLEIGSATGALAIFLRKVGFNIITCDIDDEGEVERNIRANEKQNDVSEGFHIAHTWGTPWDYSKPIKYIIASDILLYVSAYPSLVQSLLTIFEKCGSIEFLMAWNRRISESSTFFEMMKVAGFKCHHHGKCVYSFYKPDCGDEYLESLSQFDHSNM